MQTHTLHGVIPALVTPRDDARDDIDTARLASLTEYLLAAGVHGIFPTSSTGEAPSLTAAQRQTAIVTVAYTVAGRVPVLAGVGAASTAKSVRLAREAQAAGATHVAILPLHFVPLNADELFRYFAAVADSVEIPTVLYNYPARTGGQNIPPEVAARLAASHNVIGIKDSSGDLTNTLGYLRACGEDFRVFIGAEQLILPLLLMGGAGTICAAANVVPEQIVALYQTFRQEDMGAARRYQDALAPLRRIFAPGTFPAAVKAAMALRGQPVGDPFPPVAPLSDAQRAHVSLALADLEPVSMGR